ncbi:hypothetical protein ZYGR_0AF01710 [Zygosaccharomyces rouxii]|uniref:Uncharacterized protein n=1 Tax=Zygosaccharomyces rouxii TaxID=4956 RepID=A0A1Q3A808_ZYGRO|nr:hypothetical protein ZYGR_0AF01710 [Zygosaccharomyces rouxii]
MTSEKRGSNSSRLKLAAPRRGLKRSRSVFNARSGSNARNNDMRYRVNKRSRTDISQDTGRALNWLDSLIRKGRGILDSLEEEESLFKRELGEEKRRIRMQEQLIEDALNGGSEAEFEKENSGIDPSSFRQLAENVRNTLVDYNNGENDEDEEREVEEENSSDGRGEVQDLQHREDKPQPDVEQEEIVILSDEDEDGPQEPGRSEDEESEQLFGDEQEIELMSSEEDREAEEAEDEEEEFFEGQELEGQELQAGSEETGEQEEDDQSEEKSETIEEQEEGAGEIVKGLASRFFPASTESFQEKYQEKYNADTQNPSPDETSYYDASDQDEETNNIGNGHESMIRPENEAEPAFAENRDTNDSAPAGYDEVLIIEGDQPEKQGSEEQEVVKEWGDQEHEQEQEPEEPEEPEVEQISKSELEEKEEDGRELEQDQEYQQGQEQETRQGEEDDEQDEQEKDERDVQTEEPEQQSVYVSADASLQVPDYLYDYRMIANQAVQQFLQTTNGETVPSELTSNESFNDTMYETPEVFVRTQEEEGDQRDIEQTVDDVKESPKTSVPIQDNEGDQKDINETADESKEEPEATDQHRHGLNIKGTSRSLLLEQLFKPRLQAEDANASASSLEDESTMYYSTDENLIVEEPLGFEAEDQSFLSARQTEESGNVPSRYKILFCESSYSTTSNEDNAQVVEPVSTYVSPFTEDPLSNTQRVEDPKEFLRRTLESLGESFISESEDEVMEDANDFNSSSDEEYFSQTSDVNIIDEEDENGVSAAGNDDETVKGLETSDDTDNLDNTSEGMSPEYYKQFGNMRGRNNAQFQSPHAFSDVEVLVFGPSEPDWIEEAESEQGLQDQGEGLVPEEVESGSDQNESVLVTSEPIVEFNAEPLDFADIILDEFTAPDLVEEVSDTEDRVDDVVLEEIEELQAPENLHVILTEPIVEQPEPSSFANVEIVELTENYQENTNDGMLDVGTRSFDGNEDFQLRTEGGFNDGSLSGNSRDGSHESTNSKGNAEEESGEQRQGSVASRIFSSPIRALSRVISGVKDVGNVLTDFVNTVDTVNAETDSDVENYSSGDHHADSQSEAESEAEPDVEPEAEIEAEFNVESSRSAGKQFAENNSTNEELLSEVAAIQKLARELESRPISAFRDDSPSIDDDGAEQEEINTSVKKDNEPELAIGEEDSFLRNNGGKILQKDFPENEGTKEKDNKDNDIKDDVKHINVKNGDLEEMEGKSVKGLTSNKGSLETQEPSAHPEKPENSGKRLNDAVESEGSRNYENKEAKLGKEFLPVKTTEVDYSSEAPIQYENSTEEKDEPQLQTREVEVRDENEDAVQVPVEVEDEETKTSPENKDVLEEKDSEPAQSGSKKKRGRKRKHSSPISESNKRKVPGSSKSQNKRNKGPITRSRTTPSSSERKTRRNTRSKKTR